MQGEMMPPVNYSVYNQPNSMSDQLTADMMQQNRVENIITQIDPERLLTDIEHRIRRMRKDHHNGVWVKIDPNQKEISPELIANLISNLSAFLTNNLTFSNYTEQEINSIMKLLIRDLIQDLSSNASLYGLENNYPERNRITMIVCTTVFSALKRALKGTEASKFWKSVSISGDIHNAEGQVEKKRGVMDYLKFW